MTIPITARQTPAGIKLDDGFSTKIAFESNPDVSFWEKSIKPPGLDGGEPIDTTTMHNLIWRTMAPRQLIKMTDCSGKAAYDPNIYNDIMGTINVKTSVTVHFPDGTTLAFYGFLQKFETGELAEGNQPEADFTIVVTNQHPTTGVLTSPLLTSVAGT